ncbi:hypothetical protein D1007_55398 [Hordeum vulgare]|nr:hypothetical protein D1007_55398 [Hordeum vulgare]
MEIESNPKHCRVKGAPSEEDRLSGLPDDVLHSAGSPSDKPAPVLEQLVLVTPEDVGTPGDHDHHKSVRLLLKVVQEHVLEISKAWLWEEPRVTRRLGRGGQAEAARQRQLDIEEVARQRQHDIEAANVVTRQRQLDIEAANAATKAKEVVLAIMSVDLSKMSKKTRS